MRADMDPTPHVARRFAVLDEMGAATSVPFGCG